MKRYYLKTFIIFMILLVLFSYPYVKAELPLIGKTIVIDSGHGGKDPGTLYNGIYEKDINLKISKYLEEELIKKGANIIMTRDGDYDLSVPNAKRRKKSDFDNRIKVINSANANMYVSIHLNFLEQKNYYGPQVFYLKGDDSSKVLAEILQKELNDNINTNREIKEIPSSTYMYDKLNVDGVLIECGFLSNDSERKKLVTSSYQKKLAKYIANGIQQFI